MKTLFTLIALCLIGCSAVPESEDNASPPLEYHSNNTITNPPKTDVNGGPCSQTYYKQVIVDGKEVWKPLPTVCNTGLNLDKGDPSPDKGRPPENDFRNINDIKILEQQ